MPNDPNCTKEYICRAPLAIARERLPMLLSQPPFNLDADWIQIEDVENGFELMCPFQGKTDGETFALHLQMIDEEWCRRLYVRWSGLNADSQSFAEQLDLFICRLVGADHSAAAGKGIGYPDPAPYAMDALLACLKAPVGPFTWTIDNIDEQSTNITIVTSMRAENVRASVVFHIQDIKETYATIRVTSTILSDSSATNGVALDDEIRVWLEQALLTRTTT